MKRMDYETLPMEEIVIEMEDGFLAASKEKIKAENYNVTIKEQTGEDEFIINKWD